MLRSLQDGGETDSCFGRLLLSAEVRADSGYTHTHTKSSRYEPASLSHYWKAEFGGFSTLHHRGNSGRSGSDEVEGHKCVKVVSVPSLKHSTHDQLSVNKN